MAKIKYTRRGMPLEERLAVRSTPGPNGCIDFIGSKSVDGYGHVWDGRKKKIVIASRASYLVHIGPIPHGKYVLHTCDSPSCINPTHLKLGTQFDNMRDRALRKRSPIKLTDEDVRNIRKDTRKLKFIAVEYKIDMTTASQIRRRKRRMHVT